MHAAIELLTRSGPAAGSTRAIAKELGVPQATLHYVFGSKEELYRAVIVALTDELVGYVRAAEIPAAATFNESIAALTDRLWQTVIDQPSKHQLLTEVAMGALRSPQLRGIMEDHRRTVDQATASVIEDTAQHFDLKPDINILYVARYYLAAMDGLIMQHLTEPDRDSERWCLDTIVETVHSMVLNGSSSSESRKS